MDSGTRTRRDTPRDSTVGPGRAPYWAERADSTDNTVRHQVAEEADRCQELLVSMRSARAGLRRARTFKAQVAVGAIIACGVP